MNEKPLERLNYFNGQRLQAAISSSSRTITSACGAGSTDRCTPPASRAD